MNFENIKDAMKFLLDDNKSGTENMVYEMVDRPMTVKELHDNHVKSHKATAEDVKEANYETLAYIADELGMSELYLKA